MKKRLWVQHGPRHNPQVDTVELNGIASAEQLTPKMARRAASVAVGVPWGCVVTDPVWGHGYRLYRQSARKFQGQPDWQRLAEARVSAESELAPHAEIIFYDWHEGDNHLQWIATAPVAEIVDWAEAVTPEARSQV